MNTIASRMAPVRWLKDGPDPRGDGGGARGPGAALPGVESRT